MVTVVPRLDKYFEIVGVEVNGEFYRASFTVDYVAQRSSWSICMHLEYKGQKFTSPEYSGSPLITDSIFRSMCFYIQESINKYYGNLKNHN